MVTYLVRSVENFSLKNISLLGWAPTNPFTHSENLPNLLKATSTDALMALWAQALDIIILQRKLRHKLYNLWLKFNLLRKVGTHSAATSIDINTLIP